MTTGPGLEILAGPLIGGGALVRDYRAGLDLSAFYTGHPSDPQAYARKAAEVEQRLHATSRAHVAPAIQPLGDAAGRLARILDGDGFFVTTGQQPALFGGPLYTIYKILAAIRLAAVLEARLQRPVLALFWVGSDDHDWAEANHVTVLDGDDYAQRITVAAPDDMPPVPLAERTWGSDIERAVAQFAESVSTGAHGAAVLQHVREAYTAGSTVTASFTATIRFLLHDRRVALVDSADPAVRRAAAPVLQREIEHFERHTAAVLRQSGRLEAAGYSAQVAPAADASNLMLLTPEGRDRLARASSGWTTRRQRSVLSNDALLQRIAAEPERFSPNVLLRPVVESALFPTIAYVAGPAELSYFAQIGCLFRAHGMLPPVVVPRPSVTLVTPAIARVLGKHGLDASAVQRPFREVLGDAVRRELPAEVRAALDGIRTGLMEGYERLLAAAADLDPTLRGPLTSARNASALRAHEAERRIVTHMKRRDAVRHEQLRRASAHLYPGGAPQERTLGALQYVAQHGPGLIAAIEQALDMEPSSLTAWTGPECTAEVVAILPHRQARQ